MTWPRQRDQFNWICWIIQRFLLSWKTNTDHTADGKADNVVRQRPLHHQWTRCLQATAWTTANTGGSAINTGLNNDNYGRGLLAEGCCHGGNA
jgi:hypothetical protein